METAFTSLRKAIATAKEQHVGRLGAIAKDGSLDEIRWQAGYIQACDDLINKAKGIARAGGEIQDEV